MDRSFLLFIATFLFIVDCSGTKTYNFNELINALKVLKEHAASLASSFSISACIAFISGISSSTPIKLVNKVHPWFSWLLGLAAVCGAFHIVALPLSNILWWTAITSGISAILVILIRKQELMKMDAEK